MNVLRSLLNIECEDYHLVKAISTINDLNSIEIKSFEEKLKEIINKDLLRDQRTTWQIIIPFEVKINRRLLKINGITFKVLNYSTLKKCYPLKFIHSFQGQVFSSETIDNKLINYLIVEANGSSLYRAWKKVEPTFSIIRGLLDYGLSYYHWTTYSKPQPRTKIPHPKHIYGITSDSKLEFLEFFVREKTGKTDNVLDKKDSIFDKFAICLRNQSEKNSINEMLCDLLRLYSQAMDEDDTQYCYLKFWQIAERIVLSDPNGLSNETIKKRFIFYTEFFTDTDYSLKPYIDRLATKRNDLVHRGIDHIEDSDLNMLKAICDRAILWIYLNRHKIRTINHLAFYYSKRDINKSEIKTTVDVLRFIQNIRKK